MHLLSFLKTVDAFIWCPFLIVVLSAIGVYFTYKLRFIQIRRLGFALRYICEKDTEEGKKGDVSPLASLCAALSATIGTGNIVGMATAVTAGGPDALFWMSVAAFFGMATKYAESLLAVKYRTFDANGKVWRPDGNHRSCSRHALVGALVRDFWRGRGVAWDRDVRADQVNR